MIVTFCAVLFSWDVLDEIFDLIESVSGVFSTYSYKEQGWHLLSGNALTHHSVVVL